jgi:hypothetical protein
MNHTTTRPTVTIELVGAYTARHIDSGTTVDRTSKRNRSTTRSPLPVLCRELVAQGFDLETRAHVIRQALDGPGFIPVFKRDRKIGVWAELDAVENDRTPPRIVKFKPFPSDAVEGIFAREEVKAASGPADPETPEIGFHRLPGNADYA